MPMDESVATAPSHHRFIWIVIALVVLAAIAAVIVKLLSGSDSDLPVTTTRRPQNGTVTITGGDGVIDIILVSVFLGTTAAICYLVWRAAFRTKGEEFHDAEEDPNIESEPKFYGAHTTTSGNHG